MPEKISVLLVDDHSLVRRGFRRILEDEPDITVAGEAGDGEAPHEDAAQDDSSAPAGESMQDEAKEVKS